MYEHLAYFFQIGVGSGYGHTFEFNIGKFCNNFKHFPIRLEAALKILEKAGYIEYDSNGNERTRLMFLVERDELYKLNELSKEQNSVIIATLRCYSGLFSSYAIIDEGLIAQKAGIDKNEVYCILKELDKKRLVSFIPEKNVPRIKYTQNRVDTKEIIISKEVYDIRKELFKCRIEAINKYAENNYMCRSRQLLRYFGENKSSNCNQCDVCIDNRKMTKEDKEELKVIRQEILNLLSDKKEHNVEELYKIKHDLTKIEHVIYHMSDEEEIFNNNGKLTL